MTLVFYNFFLSPTFYNYNLFGGKFWLKNFNIKDSKNLFSGNLINI